MPVIPGAFLSRKSSQASLASFNQPPPLPVVPEAYRQETESATSSGASTPALFVDAAHIRPDLEIGQTQETTSTSNSIPSKQDPPVRPKISPNSSTLSVAEVPANLSRNASFEDLTADETQSCASSIFSVDSNSIYSNSTSQYSSASSLYSSSASTYSYDTYDQGSQYQQRSRPGAPRRTESQDQASRERNALAKKAALYKNSRLPPGLPYFNTSLPTWSLVCRAIQASQDCYDSRALTRRGTYTPANTSKDTKAMIIDEQLIDSSRLVIISVRGSEISSLADWAVNKAAEAAKPVGFLDDEENACHAGFLKVTKAMVAQVATQLREHPASSEQPTLLFTGHSAGGAVAALLYSHMLSTSVSSDLTALASQFSSINCVTFGAPPLSLTPLPTPSHSNGVFLSFTNEGDPVTRLSNAAYVKSLAKLLTASPPASAAAAPPPKVVRRSRGTGVVVKPVAAPLVPWAERPLWPTPAAPLANAGVVVVLRDGEMGGAEACKVGVEELREVIFADLAAHTCEMYLRRVKAVALSAMMGR